MTVAIYSGAGASKAYLDHLVRALGKRETVLLGAHALLHADWPKRVSLLIMPGGRDEPYLARLQGRGTDRIRTFVEGGGSYLGICAGAYFAAGLVDFERSTPLEVLGPRPLAFHAGPAVGPAYGKGQFEYESQKGARLALVRQVFVHFNGGPAFPQAADKNVWARYDDLPSAPPAVLRCRIGDGVAVLSGPHLEVPVAEGDEKRKELWEELLTATSP